MDGRRNKGRKEKFSFSADSTHRNTHNFSKGWGNLDIRKNYMFCFVSGLMNFRKIVFLHTGKKDYLLLEVLKNSRRLVPFHQLALRIW